MRSECTLARALRLPAIALAGTLFATGAFAAPPKPAAAPRPEAAKPAAPQPLTAETLWKLARLGAPTISPDGASAVVAVTRYDLEKDKGLTDLWLVPTAGGEARQLTTHEAADSSPLWSPDGNWIAFSSQRDGDDAPQLYLLPVAGGEARRLTQVPTGVGTARWFPDSSRLAFTTRIWEDLPGWEDQGKRLKERKESKVSARVWDRPPVTSWDHFVDDRKAHLYSIAITGGEPVAITRGSGRSLGAEGGSFDISPDGTEVAFTTDIDPTGVDSNHDVFVIPATGGTPRNLTTDNPASDGNPLYSPDGRYLAFSRQTI
ncbi:MAG TPA: DPP IV N-terminal domain-containing protein, partial [Thermoanaerobaculia bacterium]|nr:DPP IV N-terminal domain-containing protein [Thermoanaerobaculia bacterium]